ncbi:MAG: response regulator [Candidatus Heimdallarchaeaceae archaeon]
MSNQLRVLLVEDDADISFLIKINIIKAFPDAEVIITQSKNDTLNVLQEYKYNFDIILLDYLLGDITGLDILEEIRKITDIPVLIITGQGSEEVAVRAMKMGAQDYIVKRGRFFSKIPEIIEKIKSKKARFDLEKIFLAFYRFGTSGTEPIYVNRIPKEYESIKETVILSLGVMLYTLFGMGEIDKLESASLISGPVRIPKMKDYYATSLLYIVQDKGQTDHRLEGKDYCIVALAYPLEYQELTRGIDKIKNVLNKFFDNIKDVSEIKDNVKTVEEQIYNIINWF